MLRKEPKENNTRKLLIVISETEKIQDNDNEDNENEDNKTTNNSSIQRDGSRLFTCALSTSKKKKETP